MSLFVLRKTFLSTASFKIQLPIYPETAIICEIAFHQTSPYLHECLKAFQVCMIIHLSFFRYFNVIDLLQLKVAPSKLTNNFSFVEYELHSLEKIIDSDEMETAS